MFMNEFFDSTMGRLHVYFVVLLPSDDPRTICYRGGGIIMYSDGPGGKRHDCDDSTMKTSIVARQQHVRQEEKNEDMAFFNDLWDRDSRSTGSGERLRTNTRTKPFRLNSLLDLSTLICH
jgi:hypothetical protein